MAITAAQAAQIDEMCPVGKQVGLGTALYDSNTVKTYASATTENTGETITLTTDNTYLTGTDITYSGARGSSALKLTGVFTGTGGFSNIYSLVTTSGIPATAGSGVIGIKGVVTNSAAIADGNIMGAQFIAKHSHATSDMGASAVLCGMEAWAYDASTGTVGTLLGGNIGYHNECATTQVNGSVHRALQVFCDDASGADAADEATGICIWNMAGTQTNAINVTQSGSGFTNFVYFASATAPAAEKGSDYTPANPRAKITMKIGANTYYLIGYVTAT